MPVIDRRHVARAPTAIGVLFRGQQSQRGVAIGLRDHVRHVMGQLQFQDAVEIVLRRRGAEPLFQFLYASEQRFVF